MTRLNQHREYRASGVDWLGEIPAHWEMVKLKNGFDLQKRPAIKSAGIVTAFRDGQVTLRSNRRTEGYTEGDKQIGYQTIHPGDLVIHAMDAFAGAIGVSDSFGQSTPVYSACTAKPGFNAKYYARALRHIALTGYIGSLAKGVRERSTDFRWADAKELPIPRPPLEEQNNIVSFLDRESAQIDDLIGKQERLIELLAEKRQAIITHAVTKGLDSHASTKPSGIPWLGDVPHTWRTAELKRALTFITSGSRGWAEYYADHGKPFVRIGNLTRGHLHLDMAETQYVEIPPDAEGTRAVVEAGDVLFSITAYLGSVAVASEKDSGSYVSQHVAITRLDQNRLLPRFLAYFVLSEYGQRQLNEGAYGGTKLQLSLEDIKKLIIPVPGMSEQIEIARHLDTSVARIDGLVGLSRKSISLLRERRSALISAAVTGKIDVREEASQP